MRNIAFHQAHQVASDLTDNFNQMRDEIVQSMNAQAIQQREIDRAAEEAPAPEDTPAPAPAPSMNSTNDSNAQLLRVIQQMQEQLTNLSSNFSGRPGGRPRNDRRPGNRIHGRCRSRFWCVLRSWCFLCSSIDLTLLNG